MKIHSEAVNEIIEDLVEVHKTADPNIDVALLLTQLKTGINDAKKKFADFAAGFERSCGNVQTKVSNFVKHLTNSKNEAFHNKNKWEKDETSAKKSQKGNVDKIGVVQKAIKETSDKIAKAMSDYKEQVGEADEKLTIVKQLWDIIEDELLNPSQSSFIQLKNFNEHLAKLQELIKKAGDSKYSPIISTLVELARQNNFSDQSILKKILKVLGQLRDNLKNFRDSRETAFNAELKLYRSQLDSLESQLVDYSKLGQGYLSTIADSNHNIAILEKDIMGYQREIERKQREIKAVEKLCEIEKKVFKEGKTRTDSILNGINEAIKQSQQLHK